MSAFDLWSTKNTLYHCYS